MQSSAAAVRIAALQRHLQAHSEESDAEQCIEVHNTKADTSPKERPAPGGGPGSLSVLDNRTGKKYEIPISDHGTVKGTDLKKITAGGDGVGLRPYDNGWVACASQSLAYFQHTGWQLDDMAVGMSTQLLSSPRYHLLMGTREFFDTGDILLNSLLSAPTF